MARNEFYRQCRMRRPLQGKRESDAVVVQPLDGSEPYEEMTSFIPADKAKVGNVVKLKTWSHDKEWSENWEITYVGPKRRGDFVEKNADLWKHQRKMSDV